MVLFRAPLHSPLYGFYVIRKPTGDIYFTAFEEDLLGVDENVLCKPSSGTMMHHHPKMTLLVKSVCQPKRPTRQ